MISNVINKKLENNLKKTGSTGYKSKVKEGRLSKTKFENVKKRDFRSLAMLN